MIDYDQTWPWAQKDYKILCLWFNLTNDLLNFCLQLSCLKSRLLHHHIIICHFVCRNKTWRCRKTFGCLFQQHWCGRAPFSWNENEKRKTYKETLSLLSKECREKKKGPIWLIQSQRPSLRISTRCICKSLLFSNDQQRNLSDGRCSLRSRSPSSWSQRRPACMEPSPHPPASLACSLK